MQIKTRHFGSQEIDPQSILFFPEGLPGFETCHRFKLFHETGEHPIIYYLQSIDDSDVAFSVVEPKWLDLQYDLPLSKWESAVIKSSKNSPKLGKTGEESPPSESLLILVMLAGNQGGETESAQVRPLLAQPLVINPHTRRGLQLQLSREDFEVILG